MFRKPANLTGRKSLPTAVESSPPILKLRDATLQCSSPDPTVSLLKNCVCLTPTTSSVIADAVTCEDPMMKSLESGDRPDPHIMIAIFQKDSYVIAGKPVGSGHHLGLVAISAAESM
jgi:hypothetical protein